MTFRRGGGGGGGGRGRFGGRDDRARPGGRDGGLPRGGDSRPSNHTSDASMASARIFIGNLPTNDPRLTKEVLEENFSKHGHILGISILKGFGFIQYAEESSAENAIQGSQNLEFFGQRADVKNVKSGKDTGGSGPPAGGEPFRDRSPLRRRERDRDADMPPRIRDGDMRAGPSVRDMDRAAHDYDDRTRDWGRADHYHADPYMERDMHPREPYPPTAERSFGVGLPPRPAGLPMPNDVEIIVTSKVGLMRQYAEQLEGRIRAHGMAVDVLFPREDIPIRQVLMDLGERGTLFAFVLSPQNEEHRSVTLNILFGQQPEEHRNMPLEDAFGLLTSTFQRYQQQQRGGGISGRPEEPADGGRPSGPEPHPPSMQALVDLLQANRPLSVMEYDRLIRYLTERRDRQATEDGRNSASQSYLKGYNANAGPGQENPVELQQRILSILSSSAGGAGAGGLGPVPAPVPAPHLNAPVPSWNSAGESAAQQMASDMMNAYGGGPVRQPDRPMGQVQQPGGYYGMGKRF